MALVSKLFRGDPKLAAAAVSDQAHIGPGARGAHVGKIQEALIDLDNAAIDRDEVYGPATAAAVLNYKNKRRIINFSYQTQADNIVGKMTIANLDRELARRDARPPLRGCPDPVRSGSAQGSLRQSIAFGEQVAVTQLPAILSVLIQLVRVKKTLGPHAFTLAAELPKRANELLAPFGMRVAHINGFSFEVPKKIRWNNINDLTRLRTAAEAAMPGFAEALRVIVCPFRDVDEDKVDDITQNAVSAGPAIGVPNVQNFIVLNANCSRADKGTLLHEMIHCSNVPRLLDSNHESQPDNSIFSWGANRTVLREEHAVMLRDAFFSRKM